MHKFCLSRFIYSSSIRSCALSIFPFKLFFDFSCTSLHNTALYIIYFAITISPVLHYNQLGKMYTFSFRKMENEHNKKERQSRVNACALSNSKNMNSDLVYSVYMNQEHTTQYAQTDENTLLSIIHPLSRYNSSNKHRIKRKLTRHT